MKNGGYDGCKRIGLYVYADRDGSSPGRVLTLWHLQTHRLDGHLHRPENDYQHVKPRYTKVGSEVTIKGGTHNRTLQPGQSVLDIDY